ncbi:hypothetical protein V2J09_010676 [Rumex salicifolius]
MASTSYSNTAPVYEEEDTVVLECRKPEDELDESNNETDLPEITISTSEIADWSLSAILSHYIVRIKASLLNNLRIFVAALYFGVEIVFLECKTWFCDKLSDNSVSSQIQLDDLVLFWNYGIEHGMDFISELCTSYMARNFMSAMAYESFVDVPYSMLFSCIKHPHLTVQSERHLAEALLSWIYAHVEEPKHDDYIRFDWINLLQQIRVYLLPFWFLMGKQRCQYFSEFAVQSIDVILTQLQQSSMVSTDMERINNFSSWRIRLTEFTKILDLSGCPRINATNLLFSLLPCTWNCIPREGPMPTNLDHKSLSKGLSQIVSFKFVVALDFSKCPNLHLSPVLEYLSKAFPSLRTMKAAYFLDFKTGSLQKLVESCPSLDEIDLRVDVGPFMPSQASILYSEVQSARAPRMHFGPALFPYKQPVSIMTKLTLRGRTDFNDSDLHGISECFVSLCYLDIKGCFSVTDIGISDFIRRSARLHSLIASDTLFGKHSTAALCNRLPKSASLSVTHLENKGAKCSYIDIQLLHIGGCKGVEEASLSEILSQAHNLTSLCVRDISLVNNALSNFTGSSLKKLNVSNTMISESVVLHIIKRNPHLTCLKARGCKSFSQQNKADDFLSLQWSKELSIKLGKTCNLEKFATGWGFSLFSLDSLAPAIRSLKSITVGLGGSLGEEGLVQLTKFCPKLESVSLLFQEVSDYAVTNLMERLRNLRALELCYCIGDLSPQPFKLSLPCLRKLKLERVTPWMTNQDLTLLTQNFPSLIELSLIGCRCLDADSQQIISYGWPGLISLCMEECGGTTLRGVCSLLNCKALENLLLRHNGRGIKKNFILEAASKLPMLRNISLDWCDANEGDLDLPEFGNRGCLSSVIISRCKLEKCSFEVQNIKSNRKAVHKETLVLVWNSMGLQRTRVKERISR